MAEDMQSDEQGMDAKMDPTALCVKMSSPTAA